jgi:hypothetical protein
LGWVPEDVRNENDAFYHMDTKIPDEYKYGLHNLLIRHGRSCKYCKAGPSSPTREKREAEAKVKKEAVPQLDENGEVVMKQRLVPKWEGNGLMKEVMVPIMVPEGVEIDDSCIIEHLVTRLRAPKRIKVKAEESDPESDAEFGKKEKSPKTPKGRRPVVKKDKKGRVKVENDLDEGSDFEKSTDTKSNKKSMDSTPTRPRRGATKIKIEAEGFDPESVETSMDFTPTRPKRGATKVKIEPVSDSESDFERPKNKKARKGKAKSTVASTKEAIEGTSFRFNIKFNTMSVEAERPSDDKSAQGPVGTIGTRLLRPKTSKTTYTLNDNVELDQDLDDVPQLSDPVSTESDSAHSSPSGAGAANTMVAVVIEKDGDKTSNTEKHGLADDKNDNPPKRVRFLSTLVREESVSASEWEP